MTEEDDGGWREERGVKKQDASAEASASSAQESDPRQWTSVERLAALCELECN